MDQQARAFLGISLLLIVFGTLVKAQDYGYDYYYEGSAFSCASTPCQNNGTCIEGTRCECPERYEGTTCASDKHRPRRFWDEQAMRVFSLVPKKVTFKEAVRECAKEGIYGRIASNVSNPRLDGFQRMWKAFVEGEGNFDSDIENFWVIEKEYSTQLPYLRGENCTAMNFSGYIQDYPCEGTRQAIMCETPTNGACYPEIAQELCTPPEDYCSYSHDGKTYGFCGCRPGFEFNRTSRVCEDIDECAWQANDCLYPTICQNVHGSYRCGCNDGQQGNGNDTCGYVLTLQQKNVDFTKIPTTVASLTDPTSPTVPRNLLPGASFRPIKQQFARNELQGKLKIVFSVATKSVEKIVVKTLNMTVPTNSRAVYDVYVKDQKISTTSLLEFYREADRQGKLSWLKGSTPVDATLSCTSSKLRLGSKYYTFPEATPGTTTGSSEQCSNGRSMATAACRSKKENDGTFTVYYDYRTVMAVPCDVSWSAVVNQSLAVRTPEAAELAMADLDSLTADYKNISPTDIAQATKSMKTVADYVWDSNVEISASTMSSMINVANNIHRRQKYDRDTGGESNLNDTQRHQIVISLERCSTHVFVAPSQNITIESEHVALQMYNALHETNSTKIGFPGGIHFNAQKDDLNSNPCLAQDVNNVQALINQDVLSTAKEKKGGMINILPVSIMYFADAEFFPSDSNDYEVEQVLSLRISNLELENLQNPVWYQMQPKQRLARADYPELRYYKCAYHEEATGKWLSNGCKMTEGSGPPNCTCDHMTNFAVLVQTHPQLKNYALEVSGKIFCSISIIGLFLTLVIHLYFPSLRSSEVVKIHCHLALCLLLAYIVLLTSTERPRPQEACIASALFLHFFLLSSWGWMLVECVTMYRKLVTVFSSHTSYYVTMASVWVYLVSAAIVIITILISVVWYDGTKFDGWSTPESDFIPSIYVSDRLCWLQSYPLILGFLVPVGIAFLVNLIGAILILRAITWGRQKVTSSAKDKNSFHAYFSRTVTISMLLGLCWFFAIPLTLSDDPTVNLVFSWLFSITNALQGLFIFIFFCVTREDVRKLWLNEIIKFFRGTPQRTETGLFTSQLGRDTREMSTTVAIQEPSRNTAVTKLEVDIDEPDIDKEEDVRGSREQLQIGVVSSFHPKAQEQTDDPSS